MVARKVAGKSIFEIGDGNPGMANVGHELGSRAALACLVGDILKILIPVLVLNALVDTPGWQIITAWTGLGATLGHLYPFWHHFRGGKGVTTIATTIILMSPLWGILSGVVGVAAIVLSGYLSVAAVVAIAFYTIAICAAGLPLDCRLVALIFVLLTCKAHWSKLIGIRNGTTHRASLSVMFWNKVRGD